MGQNESGRVQGKVALITGGARGQGRAIALKLADEGADIVLCDVCADLPTIEYPLATPGQLAETKTMIEQRGRRCLAEIVDVRDQAGLDGLVARAVAELGRLDIVCANAGVASWGAFWELDDATWHEMIAINLTGPWRTVKAAAPVLIEQGSGSVVFTASTNGREPGPNNAHYTASKHGVLGLMKAVAVELGPHGVRANAVLPGPVMSEMIDNDVSRPRFTGGQGTTSADLAAVTRNWVVLQGEGAVAPSRIADAVIWLASDESARVTGIEVPVDGGHLILRGMTDAYGLTS